MGSEMCIRDRSKCPAAAPSELLVFEHLKHGVEHGQHDHVALNQRAIVQGLPLRISGFCLVQLIAWKWKQMSHWILPFLTSAKCKGMMSIIQCYQEWMIFFICLFNCEGLTKSTFLDDFLGLHTWTFDYLPKLLPFITFLLPVHVFHKWPFL